MEESPAHLNAGIVAEQTLNFCPFVHVSLPQLSSLVEFPNYVNLLGMIRANVFPDNVTSPPLGYCVVTKGATHCAPFGIVHSLIRNKRAIIL